MQVGQPALLGSEAIPFQLRDGFRDDYDSHGTENSRDQGDRCVECQAQWPVRQRLVVVLKEKNDEADKQRDGNAAPNCFRSPGKKMMGQTGRATPHRGAFAAFATDHFLLSVFRLDRLLLGGIVVHSDSLGQ